MKSARRAKTKKSTGGGSKKKASRKAGAKGKTTKKTVSLEARRSGAKTKSAGKVARTKAPSRGTGARLADVAAPGAALDPASMTCTNGWQVTGYYTPLETDFSGSPETIRVLGQGSLTFASDFLKAVRMEGWGRTRSSWFLGFDRGQYVSANSAESALAQPLRIGSLAVDKREIPFGTTVRITGLPAPWNNQVFVADDVGSMINSKHVDVYCGEGASAHAETLRITADNLRLCQGKANSPSKNGPTRST
jgi:hypothetical protein